MCFSTAFFQDMQGFYFFIVFGLIDKKNWWIYGIVAFDLLEFYRSFFSRLIGASNLESSVQIVFFCVFQRAYLIIGFDIYDEFMDFPMHSPLHQKITLNLNFRSSRLRILEFQNLNFPPLFPFPSAAGYVMTRTHLKCHWQ